MPLRPAIHRPIGIAAAHRHVGKPQKTTARGYGWLWQRIRMAFAAVHPAICEHCGYAGPSREMHLDHKKPKIEGGTDEEDNLQWLCGPCNSTKQDMSDEDAKRINQQRRGVLE